MKSKTVTFQIKSTEQHFPVVPFVFSVLPKNNFRLLLIEINCLISATLSRFGARNYIPYSYFPTLHADNLRKW